MIEDLQLKDKRDVPSSSLSGGMKRKLRQGHFMFVLSRFLLLISDRSKPTYRVVSLIQFS